LFAAAFHIFWNFAIDFYALGLENAIRKAHLNQKGLKLNRTHESLVCADEVNKIGKSVNAARNNIEG
jgi:hypothetical protein